MSSFEKFTSLLEAEGLTLRKQWEFKREDHTIAHYLIYGQRDRAHHEIIVQHWPNGGYSTYFPQNANDIASDVTAILGN